MHTECWLTAFWLSPIPKGPFCGTFNLSTQTYGELAFLCRVDLSSRVRRERGGIGVPFELVMLWSQASKEEISNSLWCEESRPCVCVLWKWEEEVIFADRNIPVSTDASSRPCSCVSGFVFLAVLTGCWDFNNTQLIMCRLSVGMFQYKSMHECVFPLCIESIRPFRSLALVCVRAAGFCSVFGCVYWLYFYRKAAKVI